MRAIDSRSMPRDGSGMKRCEILLSSTSVLTAKLAIALTPTVMTDSGCADQSRDRRDVRQTSEHTLSRVGAVVWRCRTSRDLTIGRSLRPTRWRLLEVLLAPIGCHVKQAAGVRECFGPARVDR